MKKMKNIGTRINVEAEAEVKIEGHLVTGYAKFTLDNNDEFMAFLCERKGPCDWKILKQWFKDQEVAPADYENLSELRLATLTGALEEKYQQERRATK